ncbi:MAG TPA: SagB family peptide dehydrogenase [Vicinamibacterales bacterium]|nr:SagB family peptide dehydrogenase [Vicinamibacterales bacterium]
MVYWRGRTLIACNYATGELSQVPPRAFEILNACDDWTPVDDLAHAGFVSDDTFPAVIEKMVALGLLERSDRPRDRRALAMDVLAPWNPQAGFFHTTTRDVRFTPRAAALRKQRAKAARLPPPPAIKRYPGAPRVDLPPAPAHDEFAAVLRARRTWRRYSSAAVTRDEMATLLALTAGVQQWIETDDVRLPLKTSPSGGARHSIECYLVVRAVSGLKSGIYHYAPDRHALVRIAPAVTPARMRAYVPTSEYFANASAMVFFTVIFDRLLWRYPYARAYRAALIECGHLCQTFCLTATRLGLAPYSVMGLADSIIEQDLGIDGIRESVLYAAGVGRPPRGTSWAARPNGPNPPTRRNPRV